MFFGRKSPAERDWNSIKSWLLGTEDRFNALTAKRLAELEAAERTLTGRKRPSRDTMSPREAWDEILEIAAVRRELMESSWLPPREKDVVERTGNKGGLWLAGFPTKWNANRKYEKRELPSRSELSYVFDLPPG